MRLVSEVGLVLLNEKKGLQVDLLWDSNDACVGVSE